MPFSPRHEQQKKKNYTMLVVLLALFVLLFSITLMRMSNL